MKGSDLVGLSLYAAARSHSSIPPESNHEIIVGEEFVSADDGSGVVHMSPAFGADDYRRDAPQPRVPAAGRRARSISPRRCRSSAANGSKDADPILIEELQRRGVLFKAGTDDALVSALLALRNAAAVLRALVVVRAHDRVQGRDARAQRARELESRV